MLAITLGMTNKTYKLAPLLLLIALSGCASFERVRPNALDPDSRDLKTLKDNLVFFTMTISQADPTIMRLHRVIAKNTATQESWVFPFFSNAILGSKPLPFDRVNNVTEHIVFLDLPKGVYTFTKFDLVASNLTLNLDVKRPLVFEIASNEPIYLGRLTVDLTDPKVSSALRTTKSGQSIDLGYVDIRPSNEATVDLAKAREKYPVLATLKFASGKITLAR